MFPWGTEYASVNNVLYVLLASSSVFVTKSTTCPRCSRMLSQHLFSSHLDGEYERDDFDKYISQDVNQRTVTNWFNYYFATARSKCSTCRVKILDETYPDINFHFMPPIMSVRLLTTHIKINYKMSLTDNEDYKHEYVLQGIVYYGGSHFVSRIIDSDSYVWYNDGMQTGRLYVKEKSLREFSNTEIHTLRIGSSIYYSCFAIYTKV